VLKAAGVVDAGGAGLLLLLACLREHVTAGKVALPPRIFRPAAQLVSANGRSRAGDGSIADLHYEIVFMLEGDVASADRLKRPGAGLGSRSSSWAAEGWWKCHIHTDDVGRPSRPGSPPAGCARSAVTNLLEQGRRRGLPPRAFGFEPSPKRSTPRSA